MNKNRIGGGAALDELAKHSEVRCYPEGGHVDAAVVLGRSVARTAPGLPVEEESHEGIETLGGLIAAKLGRIPNVGEQIGIGARTLRVEERDGRRVARVRLLPVGTDSGQKKAAPARDAHGKRGS